MKLRLWLPDGPKAIEEHFTWWLIGPDPLDYSEWAFIFSRIEISEILPIETDT